MAEIWRDVVEFPDHYSVSNHGRIRTKPRFVRRTYPERILKPTTTNYGYHSVMLSIHGIGMRRQVHPMVLEAFVGPRPIDLICNHKDGNKTNNHVSNLEWVTHAENLRHSRDVLGNKLGGEAHQIMTADKVERALELRRNGWPCEKIAEVFGVSASLVHRLTGNLGWSLTRARGIKIGNSRLNEDIVRDIRRMHLDGRSQESIASQIGVGQSTISRVILRQCWRHVS